MNYVLFPLAVLVALLFWLLWQFAHADDQSSGTISLGSERWPLVLGVGSLILVGGYTGITALMHLPLPERAVDYDHVDLVGYPLPPDAPVERQWAHLGDKIEFLGYRYHISQKGEVGQVLLVTLFWHASAPPETSYTVFVHLLEQGAVRTQQDQVPLRGNYPTNIWTDDEVIVDRYELVLSPDIPPGTYWVEVGMYKLSTMLRLLVFDAQGTRQDFDRVLLSTPIQVP